MLIINPGFGISGWFMNEHFSAKNIPFEIKYFHFIPFQKSMVRKRTLFSQKYSLQTKKYYRAYIVTTYVMYWYILTRVKCCLFRQQWQHVHKCPFTHLSWRFWNTFFLHFVTDQSQLFPTKRKVCDGNFLTSSPPPSAALGGPRPWPIYWTFI